MAFPQQHEVHLTGNPSRAADAPWSATGFPSPQHPQSAPSSYTRSLPGQLHGHTGVLRDAVLPAMNAAGSRRPNEDRENTPLPVENLVAQAQPQDLQYADMGYYDMANDYPPPHGHGNHIRGDNVQHVPAQAQAAPPAPVIDAFNNEVQRAATGPAPAFNEFLDQGPVPNRRASEVLRQLAILYLNDPNSQLAMLHMEPGYADGVMVVITLKLTDL